MRRLFSSVALSSLLILAAACGDDPEGTSQGSERTPGAPVFGGVGAGEAVSDTSVRLRWASALDDATPRGRLIYRVYQGNGTGPVDVSKHVAVSVPGDTSVVVQGLAPRQSYRFVVRAVDAEGNEDDNRASVTVTTGDESPPVFAGVTGATPLTSSTVLVQWKPASDSVDPALDLRYRVYRSTSSDPETLFEEPVATTKKGEMSLLLEGQPAEKELFFAVRAVDLSDNEDANTRVVSTLTPEGKPPEFDGVRSATAHSTSVTLRWSPAVDEVTASSEIVYAIYLGKKSGGQNLLAPHVVTAPGVTRFTVNELTPDTDYYFVVRARDAVGNEDDNVVQVAVTTAPPDEIPPTFSGATALTPTTPTSLNVSWAPATDDQTASQDVAYDVYLKKGSGLPSFSTPTLTTLPGRTSAELLGLTPGSEHSVVVRARDAAGNRDENEVVVSASTPAATSDKTAPVLGGTVTVARVAGESGKLLVSWPQATDAVEGALGIRYHVCVSQTGTECSGESFIDSVNATSSFGASSVVVTGLDSRTLYRATVRPEDKSGNLAKSGLTGQGTTGTSFEQDVLPIVESRCNQCHTYDYDLLVQVPSTYTDLAFGVLALVSPGEPSRSYLFRKLRAAGDQTEPFSAAEPSTYAGARMPSDKTDWLSPETEAIIGDWIVQGAYDD